MSKVESFCWNKLSSKSCPFESKQFFDLCFVLAVLGAALIRLCIYHYCVVREKEFSRKVGMSKVETFYWNELSNESWSVESEQFFYSCFVWLPFGAFALRQDESQHYGKSTKVIFLERELNQFKNFLENLKGLVMLYFRIGIDFRYCDFYMLILLVCESESESQSESESESESESGDIQVS